MVNFLSLSSKVCVEDGSPLSLVSWASVWTYLTESFIQLFFYSDVLYLYFQGEQLCGLLQLQVFPTFPFLLHGLLCIHRSHSLSVFLQILVGKWLLSHTWSCKMDKGFTVKVTDIEMKTEKRIWMFFLITSLILSVFSLLYRENCQTGLQNFMCFSSCLWHSCFSSASYSFLATTAGWWPRTDQL